MDPLKDLGDPKGFPWDTFREFLRGVPRGIALEKSLGETLGPYVDPLANVLEGNPLNESPRILLETFWDPFQGFPEELPKENPLTDPLEELLGRP